MGLDMYLTARKYVSEYTNKEDFEKLNSVDFGQGEFPVRSIEVGVKYWRKANAIHDWFVRECQNGVDDCGEYRVEFEKMVQLRDTCREVLANRDKAEDLLPTTSGFFFGSTEYDDWYFTDIESTEATLTAILESDTMNPSKYIWDYYYHSSW